MRAVLWDMDGTLLDTERYWFESEIELMVSHGLEWSMADAIGQVGQPIPMTAVKLKNRGLPGTESAIADELVDRVRAKMLGGLPWQPGVLEVLRELRESEVRSALVTMAALPLAEVTLAAAGDLFDIVVTADDVSSAKPDPAPFLMAMEKLGLGSQACLAVEDSVPGVVSAWRSGAVTLAVRRYSDLSGVDADQIIETLEGVSVATLREIHRNGVARRRE